jgi:tetratricopeptide (TPR) repeat protein
VLIVAPLGFNYSACDISGFRLAERYGRDLLDSAPQKGLVFLKSDNGSHTALYLHYLEKYRPDLEVYATNSTLARLMKRFGGGDYSRIVDSLDRTTTRVFRGAEFIINQGAPPGYPDRELVGFLYGPGVAETDRMVQVDQRIDRFVRDSLDQVDLKDDLKARQIYLEYRLWEIDRIMRSGDQTAVMETLDRLRSWSKQIGDPHTCLAVSQFFRMRGATDEALAWVDIAFAAHPGSLARRDINIGLASIRRQRGEISEAAAALETATKIDPASIAARYNLNLLKVESALQRKDYSAALAASIELTRLEPDNPLPYFNIGVIYDHLAGEQKKALQAYQEFLYRGGGAQYPEGARRARERIDLLTSELNRP